MPATSSSRWPRSRCQTNCSRESCDRSTDCDQDRPQRRTGTVECVITTGGVCLNDDSGSSGECRLKCRSRTCPGSRSTKAIVAINLKPAFPHTEDCRFSTLGGIERVPRAGERRCRSGRPAVLKVGKYDYRVFNKISGPCTRGTYDCHLVGADQAR